MRKDCLYEVVDFRGRQLECDVTNQMMKPLEYGTKSTWNEDFYCKICKYSFRLKTKELNLPTTREFQIIQNPHPKHEPPPSKKNKKQHEKHLRPGWFSMEMCVVSFLQVFTPPRSQESAPKS